MSLKTRFSAIYLVCALLLGANASAAELSIDLKTSPAVGLLRPFADPVRISLLVTYADGRPVEQGSVDIVLDAPRSGAFFSTDFPMVEGSRLLELALPLRQGRAGWKYLFPIRGEYLLSVSVTAADGRVTAKNFVISILENRAKWLWLSLLCVGLFFFGFAAGRIFTVIPATAATSALLLFLGGISTVNGHDGPSPVDKAASPPTALEIAGATVGKPTRLRWRAPDGGNLITLLSLTITHLEKGKMVFAMDGVPVAKQYLLDFHFPDGAEYRVSSLAEVPGQEPVRTVQLVSVTGVEPPVTAQIPALVFFLALIALGLGVGRYSKISRKR